MKTIGNIIHHKNSWLIILDNDGNELYFETPLGYWEIRQYDNRGSRIYYENSEGTIDHRRL